MKKIDNLIYKLDNIEGVEIDTLCKSLKAIEEEYKSFTNNQKSLVIKEIRKGSGIFEFVEVAVVATLVFAENVNTIVQFAEYLAAVKDVLLKKKDNLPDNTKLTPTRINNMNSILSPVINGNNNTINLYVGNTNTKPIVDVGQQDYNEIKKQSKQVLENLKVSNDILPEDCIYKKVLFQWVQTRFDNKRTGNQGVIRRVQDKPVKIIFADDNSDAKTEMTTTTQEGIDWQKVKYIVDVEVIVDNDRIVAYKILKNYPDDCLIETDNNSLELFKLEI